MSELSAATSDLDAPDAATPDTPTSDTTAPDEPPRRYSLRTDAIMGATGLLVRADLYDEDYSEDEYEQMLEMYNGTLASIDEGEIVKSTVLEIRENLVVLDIGFKSEGTIPLEEFKDMPDLSRR